MRPPSQVNDSLMHLEVPVKSLVREPLVIVRRITFFPLLAAAVLVAAGVHAAHATSQPAAAPSNHVAVLTGSQVIEILDETVDWYRTLGIQQKNATEPSDLLILFANRQTADKVVSMAFDIARANAELLSRDADSDQSATAASALQALRQQQSQLDSQQESLQKEISGGRPELQGALAMVKARKNLLDTMSAFNNSTDPKAADANALKAQIDAIAATVPSSSIIAAAGPSGSTSRAAQTGAGLDSGTPAPTRVGLWALTSNVLKQRNKIEAINLIDRGTAELAEMFKKVSAAPLKQLQTYTAQSDALAAQTQGADGVAVKSLRSEFDTLAWLFKQTSDILLPLSKEEVLLQQYRHNLGNWRDSTQKQYHEALATLGLRLAVVAGILVVVFALAEIWRRAALRYAHEPRRRAQLLLIRSLVLWPVVAVIVGLSVVTEIGTFATFAGLLTAGLAVAMQSVLVSIVGYFFLIGKFGIRVGDRIQIGTVVGEVIDIGLVRMHLMELNQQGPLGPTGRVVAFANLIVFQASGGLFKQIPGVNLSWHETTLTLPSVSDYAALKTKLMAAITSVLSEHREEFSRQTKEIKKSTDSSLMNDAAATIQMRLVNGHMDALIRYPVHLDNASLIDEAVGQALLKVISATA